MLLEFGLFLYLRPLFRNCNANTTVTKVKLANLAPNIQSTPAILN